jgi:hypothetical protein
VSPSQGERYVYLVNDDDVERWPSSTLVPAEQRSGGFCCVRNAYHDPIGSGAQGTPSFHPTLTRRAVGALPWSGLRDQERPMSVVS